jgi:acetyl esterase/lipase
VIHLEEDVVEYARPGGISLRMRVLRRPGARGAPAMLDLHGGAWTHFGPEVDFYWCRELARRGFVVAQVAFRLAPDHPWPAFFSDVRAAARFFRHRAARFGADASRIGVLGGSTGGHLATLLALSPRDVPATAAIDTPPDVPDDVAWAVALWPILDVPGRHRLVTGTAEGRLVGALVDGIMARRGSRSPSTDALVARLARLDGLRRSAGPAADVLLSGIQRGMGVLGALGLPRAILYRELARAHRGAFRDVDDMRAASPLAIVREGRFTRTPPLLVVQGAADTNTTRDMTEAFATAYRQRGGEIVTEYPPGLGHSFGNLPSREADRLVDRIADFVAASSSRVQGISSREHQHIG